MCALVLTSCGFLTTVPREPPSGPIQESLLVTCPEDLPELPSGEAGDIALTMREYQAQYKACAEPHNGLVKAVRERQSTGSHSKR